MAKEKAQTGADAVTTEEAGPAKAAKAAKAAAAKTGAAAVPFQYAHVVTIASAALAVMIACPRAAPTPTALC